MLPPFEHDQLYCVGKILVKVLMLIPHRSTIIAIVRLGFVSKTFSSKPPFRPRSNVRSPLLNLSRSLLPPLGKQNKRQPYPSQLLDDRRSLHQRPSRMSPASWPAYSQNSWTEGGRQRCAQRLLLLVLFLAVVWQQEENGKDVKQGGAK